jgi:hypothetical protein
MALWRKFLGFSTRTTIFKFLTRISRLNYIFAKTEPSFCPLCNSSAETYLYWENMTSKSQFDSYNEFPEEIFLNYEQCQCIIEMLRVMLFNVILTSTRSNQQRGIKLFILIDICQPLFNIRFWGTLAHGAYLKSSRPENEFFSNILKTVNDTATRPSMQCFVLRALSNSIGTTRLRLRVWMRHSDCYHFHALVYGSCTVFELTRWTFVYLTHDDVCLLY